MPAALDHILGSCLSQLRRDLIISSLMVGRTILKASTAFSLGGWASLRSTESSDATQAHKWRVIRVKEALPMVSLGSSGGVCREGGFVPASGPTRDIATQYLLLVLNLYNFVFNFPRQSLPALNAEGLRLRIYTPHVREDAEAEFCRDIANAGGNRRLHSCKKCATCSHEMLL